MNWWAPPSRASRRTSQSNALVISATIAPAAKARKRHCRDRRPAARRSHRHEGRSFQAAGPTFGASVAEESSRPVLHVPVAEERAVAILVGKTNTRCSGPRHLLHYCSDIEKTPSTSQDPAAPRRQRRAVAGAVALCDAQTAAVISSSPLPGAGLRLSRPLRRVPLVPAEGFRASAVTLRRPDHARCRIPWRCRCSRLRPANPYAIDETSIMAASAGLLAGEHRLTRDTASFQSIRASSRGDDGSRFDEGPQCPKI